MDRENDRELAEVRKVENLVCGLMIYLVNKKIAEVFPNLAPARLIRS